MVNWLAIVFTIIPVVLIAAGIIILAWKRSKKEDVKEVQVNPLLEEDT